MKCADLLLVFSCVLVQHLQGVWLFMRINDVLHLLRTVLSVISYCLPNNGKTAATKTASCTVSVDIAIGF